MIVGAFLYLVYLLILALTSPLRLLPDVSLPASFTSAVATASGYLSSISDFVAVSTLVTILAAMLAIEVVVLSYKLIVWVLTKVPGISN